jgi:ABC-type transporter Mla maintaining outer membrane lipid asymmetry ATPase subunit MlaF
MPKKVEFDGKKLLKMIKDETPKNEIMGKFKFKTATQLKNAHYRALIESGEVPSIVGGRGAGKSAKGKLIGVGKRGSIIIPAEKVAELEIGKDDKFTVRKTKAGIALKKV